MNDFREDEQEWFVIGVAWFGEKAASCQSSAKPNLYARVSNYVGWIHDQTGIPRRDRPTTTIPTTPPTTTRTPTTEDPNKFSCK
jgi:secreted trypsin-like serine protease